MAVAAKSTLYNSVGCQIYKWTLTDANPGGDPITLRGKYADKSVQAFGTFGTGGAVKIQGTNEVTSPANWYNLCDPQGTEISITAAKIEQVLENAYQFRPYLSAGTGVTVDVYLCVKG